MKTNQRKAHLRGLISTVHKIVPTNISDRNGRGLFTPISGQRWSQTPSVHRDDPEIRELDCQQPLQRVNPVAVQGLQRRDKTSAEHRGTSYKSISGTVFFCITFSFTDRRLELKHTRLI